MCLIIDANLASRVFARPCEADFSPIWDWIENRDGKLVFGGKLAQELGRVRQVARRLIELSRAGRALRVSSEEIDQEERRVLAMEGRKSDDPHVLALARACGARVLCTLDEDLQADFKNLNLVPRPKGKIYKNRGHKQLLGHNGICAGRPRGR
jgi:predicted nucleic acid-binding protein